MELKYNKMIQMKTWARNYSDVNKIKIDLK